MKPRLVGPGGLSPIPRMERITLGDTNSGGPHHGVADLALILRVIAEVTGLDVQVEFTCRGSRRSGLQLGLVAEGLRL